MIWLELDNTKVTKWRVKRLKNNPPEPAEKEAIAAIEGRSPGWRISRGSPI